MDPDISKWPLVYQIIAGIGASLGGLLMYLRGSKAVPNTESSELARLREERDRQISIEIKALRADFEIVVGAMKDSFRNEFESLKSELRSIDDRLREIETKIAVIEDRYTRPRR